ncbi:hemagglutinin [Candidatus Synechococcus calcipolaris G9]|uniref:Hemagglutinin n=1 Tax=Candidatus Synechococcus calcipolaris G9 TaxID=1497997 RepID=A0ABT6EZQ5_9SYNE|nr:hemagglutinin [Candidatus Synechococcus calcipolaris]MDG2991062.1 hemagglutinin [Candidatus Synechococcus calcipolaris G9]
MQTQIHDLTIEVKVSQAETSEKFNTLEERLSGEINTVRAEIKAVDDKLSGQIKAVDDKVIDLQDRQKTVDSRLWGFIVTLTGAIIAYLIKLSFFDQRLG